MSDFKVIDEAKNGEDAVKLCRKNAPDVVLMDVNMPGIGGLEATKKFFACLKIHALYVSLRIKKIQFRRK
ncbi:hypothetical protein KUL49_13440 [Alteromonas sp. KUL49]|nr:hypothetical protein KUL49_13440 [Alteromonas sp. KUL49]